MEYTIKLRRPSKEASHLDKIIYCLKILPGGSGEFKLAAELYEIQTNQGKFIYSSEKTTFIEAMDMMMKAAANQEKLLSDLSLLDILPDFIRADVWGFYVQHRKEKRVPLKKTSAQALIKKLTKMFNDGEDVNACIMASVENGYQGIFPLKNKGVNHGRKTRIDGFKDIAREFASLDTNESNRG